MAELFLKILNMSITAGWIVLAVIILRLLLKKSSKWIRVLLWGVVGIRLICPFSFESIISLIPSAETISPEIMLDAAPKINSGIPIINNTVNSVIGSSLTPEPSASANPLQILIPILAIIWLVGIVGMLIYSVVSYICIKRRVETGVLLRDNIYQIETVASPFVLGIIKPKIYLPFNIDGKDMEYVIAHEEAHIYRKDHLWKPLGFLLLTIHWFNPLIWIGYILLCRDIELACDEKVVKELSSEERADYSQALLTCSVNRRMIAACPLAFGEVGVKGRVKSILNYKKPAFWVVIAAILVSVAVAVCFLTNPASNKLGGIENNNLWVRTAENTAVLISDGTTNKYVGAISSDLLSGLYDLKISKKEISPSRDEERDKSNTLILNLTPEESEEIMHSYANSTYIHFNSDFSSVWLNDSVKPTFSYKVINPEKAKEVFENIKNYNLNESESGENEEEPQSEPTDIDKLKVKYPQFFNVPTDDGLTVYIWQMAKNSYSCYLANTELEAISDNSFAYEVGATLTEMRAILTTYNVDKEDITVQAVINPLSSYYYEINDEYREKIKELFWGESTTNGNESYDPSKIPSLTVGYGDLNVAAITGDLRWTYSLGNNQSHTIDRDEGNPLQNDYDNNTLPINIVNRDETPLDIDLKFDLAPDTMKANAWFFAENGQAKPFDVTVNGLKINSSNIINESGKYVIEVVATWNSSKEYSGEIRYSFASNVYLIEDNGIKEIEDKGIVGPELLEKFYEDENFVYLFSIIKSDRVIVKFNNGKEMNVKDALALGLISISDLDKWNIAYSKEEKVKEYIEDAIERVLIEKYKAEKPDGLIHAQYYTTLAKHEASGTPKVGETEHVKIETAYIIACAMTFRVTDDGLEEARCSIVPTIMTFSADKNGYTLKDYWTAGKGESAEKEIRERFPEEVVEIALNPESEKENLKKFCLLKAEGRW